MDVPWCRTSNQISTVYDSLWKEKGKFSGHGWHMTSEEKAYQRGDLFVTSSKV